MMRVTAKLEHKFYDEFRQAYEIMRSDDPVTDEWIRIGSDLQ